MLIDSHCHLDHLDLSLYGKNLEELLSDANKSDVGGFLTVATTLAAVAKNIQIANSHSNIYVAIGVQPSEEVTAEPTVDEILELAANQKIIAIGECGLDYFYQNISKEVQQQRFVTQIKAAMLLKKPLIIHMRAALEETIELLQEHKADTIGGVMHCFTENWAAAKMALDLNFYLSFSGIVTFKKAEQLKEVAKKAPLNRILIETDSPYLAPVPLRGKPNQPAYLRYIAEYLAEIRNVSYQTIATSTTENFCRLFSINF